MQSVKQMNATGTAWIRNVVQDGRQPSAFRLGGELGFRTQRCIRRIESELPYSREYILSRMSGAADQWSNFRTFHGDIAGRWIVAMTHAHAGGNYALSRSCYFQMLCRHLRVRDMTRKVVCRAGRSPQWARHCAVRRDRLSFAIIAA